MEKLNNKIKNGRTELINDAQMVALYGYDGTADRLRRLTCDTAGKLNIEATLELDSSGLNKEATQLEVKANQTNGTQESRCIGGETDGTQKQILVSNLGVVQTLDSEVFGKTSQIANQTTLSNTNEATIIANQTNGTSKVQVLGNTEPDGSGTNEHLHTDGNGNLNVQVINSVNTLPANTLNSGITNDPADSVAVGLRARQTITDASTETFLKCNASGELLTSGGGGGGSSTYTLEQQSAPTGTIQIIGDGSGNQYIDTNGGSKFVVIVQTGNGAGSPQVSLEWSDNTSFSVNQVIVCNGFFSGLANVSPTSLVASTRVDTSTLTTQQVFQFDTIPARYVRITIRQTSGSAITYTGKTALSP